jgi:hypothetical protein
MTNRAHSNTQPPKESARARAAFVDYRSMPPGTRSLTNLIGRYRGRSAAEEPPPTRRLDTLKYWSQAFHWVARIAAYDAEMDFARKQEALRQAEQQARENSKLLQQVGQGSLALCALSLQDLVDQQTGELRHEVDIRDVCGLMRSGAELLQLAFGAPTQIVANTTDATQIERCLRESDPQTREVVLRGLRAALEWQQRQGGV